MGLSLASFKMKVVITVFTLCFVASIQSSAPWYESHFRELTKDVVGLTPGTSESVLPLFGQNAFPVAVNGDNLPTIVAGIHGTGRFVAAGDWYYLFKYYNTPPRGADSKKLTENAVKWLTKGKTSPKIACRDKWSVLDQATTTNVKATEDLSSFDVYAMWSQPYEKDAISDAEVEAILQFVADGGALIVAGALDYLPIEDYVELKVNKIVTKMGTMFGRKHSSPLALDFTNLPPAKADAVVALETFATVADIPGVVDIIGYCVNENALKAENVANFQRVYDHLPSVLEKYNQLANNEETFRARQDLYGRSFQTLYPYFIAEVFALVPFTRLTLIKCYLGY